MRLRRVTVVHKSGRRSDAFWMVPQTPMHVSRHHSSLGPSRPGQAVHPRGNEMGSVRLLGRRWERLAAQEGSERPEVKGRLRRYPKR